MCVEGEYTQIDTVCSGASGAQRYRHLVATETGFAGIDALTSRVGHGDGAEGRFQLLGKPQRDLARSCRNLIADARLGMIEKSVGSSFTGRERKQQRNDANES